jgi:hypothetical protein
MLRRQEVLAAGSTSKLRKAKVFVLLVQREIAGVWQEMVSAEGIEPSTY